MEPKDKIPGHPEFDSGSLLNSSFEPEPMQEPEKFHTGSNILFFFFVFSIVIHVLFLFLFFRCGCGPAGVNVIDRMKSVFITLSPQEQEKLLQKRRDRQQDLLKRLKECAPQKQKERRAARLRAPKSSFGWVFFDNEPQVKKVNDLVIPTDLIGDAGKAKSVLATELEPQVSKNKVIPAQNQVQDQESIQTQAQAKIVIKKRESVRSNASIHRSLVLSAPLRRVSKPVLSSVEGDATCTQHERMKSNWYERLEKQAHIQEKPQEQPIEQVKKVEEKQEETPKKLSVERAKLAPTALVNTPEKKPEPIVKASEKKIESVVKKTEEKLPEKKEQKIARIQEEKPKEQASKVSREKIDDHDGVEHGLIEELKNTREQDAGDFISEQEQQGTPGFSVSSDVVIKNAPVGTSSGATSGPQINFEPVSVQDQNGSSVGNVHVRGARRADGKEQKRNMFALMKGFIEKKIGEEGTDLIDQDGDPDVKPTFDEMRFISYQSKITHALQASWKLNFERYPTRTNLHLPAHGCVEFTIAKDGHLVQCKLIETSGQPELDKMLVKHFEFASPFPPIPDHLSVNSITQRMNIMVSPESIQF